MYDVAIIGAGIAGISCAKYAIKSGFKTILIDRGFESFGGVCLNYGCIPTKFLLQQAHHAKEWFELIKSLKDLILKIKTPLFNHLQKMGVEIKFGKATFFDEHTLQVKDEQITAKNFIIATGSLPKKININHKEVVASEEIFCKTDIPNKIAIVGGGYIGIEFASLFNMLGKEVLVIEKQENILPNLDYNLSRRLESILKRKGIQIYTGKDFAEINLDEFDMVISAVGRYANIADLGLDKTAVKTTNDGWIVTDDYLRTSCEHIYCCGDVTGKHLFAYTAEYQAYICIGNILGNFIKEDYKGLPECVFSIPQVATVGLNKETIEKLSIKDYRIISSNFLKFSSAYVYDDTDGFLEIIVDKNDRILGASIISNFASELISIFSIAVKKELSIKDFKELYLIHPSLSEIIPAIVRNI